LYKYSYSPIKDKVIEDYNKTMDFDKLNIDRITAVLVVIAEDEEHALKIRNTVTNSNHWKLFKSEKID
jgi:hypothetical protein